MDKVSFYVFYQAASSAKLVYCAVIWQKLQTALLPKVNNFNLLVLSFSYTTGMWPEVGKRISGFLEITVEGMLHKRAKSHVCLDTLELTNISRIADYLWRSEAKEKKPL